MRKLATIETVKEILPIENADTIEKIRIRDWWVVSKKNTFKVGDKCVFFEIDSLLPITNPAFEFLAKGNKPKTQNLDGIEYIGYRLKTVKLRNQISQGLVIPISEFKNIQEGIAEMSMELKEGTDVSEILNVIKYERPIPVSVSGKVKGFFPNFIPKTDEERIQNCSDILSKHKGKDFYITEKMDGFSASFYKKDDVFGVCSRNLELIDTPENTLWNIARNLKLAEKLPEGFAIQGEMIGEGIQSNHYKMKGQNLYVFNVYDINNRCYLDFEEFIKFCQNLNINTVPIVNSAYMMSGSAEELLEMANGISLLSESTNREGLVFRPIIETKDEINGIFSRLSFKCISNSYLLKHDE